MNFLDLITAGQLKDNLIPYFQKNDVFNLRLTSKNLKKFVDDELEKIRQKICDKFIQHYGYISDTEKQSSIAKLKSKIKKRLNIKLDTSSNFFHYFNKNEELSSYDYRSIFTINSFWQRLQTKYFVYREKNLQETYTTINDLFKTHEQIIKEITNNKPCTSLQELRDYSCRLQVIKKEQSILISILKANQKTHKSFIQDLSKLERTIFRIFSYFHFSKNLSFNQKKLPLFFDFHQKVLALNLDKIKLSETQILFNGEEIPVEIVGSVSLNKDFLKYNYDGCNFCFNGRIKFDVLNKSTKQILGSMQVTKRWDVINAPSGGYVNGWDTCSEEENISYVISSLSNRYLNTGYPQSLKDYKLANCRLHVTHLEDFLEQDTSTHHPIKYLLIQFAIEIFSREKFTTLCIGAGIDNFFPILSAGGNSRNNEIDNQRLQQVQDVRNSGKLFPTNIIPHQAAFQVYDGIPHYYGNDFYFYKNHSNEIVDTDCQPVNVRFSMKSQLTWKTKIQDFPLLRSNETSILPKYVNQDVTKYEYKKHHTIWHEVIQTKPGNAIKCVKDAFSDRALMKILKLDS